MPQLVVRDCAEWRGWLTRHHTSESEVWLVFFKRGPTLAYEDCVREALCFGWIDSLIKRLDDDRYVRKFTPRKPTSKWSPLNRKRWSELKDAGLLASPGVAAAPTDNSYSARPKVPVLPTYIAKAFK